MHLLYLSGQKHDYVGYCKYGPQSFLEQDKPVKLEFVCVATVMMHPQHGYAINQRAISHGNWFKENIFINPKNIVDAREMPADSPIARTYDTALEKAREHNSGITLVKKMPVDMPPQHNLN